jgi:hypothetical protein
MVNPHPEYKNLLFNGFLDIVLYHEGTNRFKIVDIKTSKSGWDDKTKKNETKQLQLVLYKKFFSQQFGIPEDDIDIEFFIVKRKVWEDSPFPISRIQTFTPSHGKVKINKATNTINDFIETVFNKDNKHVDTIYQPIPSGGGCFFCPFKNNKVLCPVGVS